MAKAFTKWGDLIKHINRSVELSLPDIAKEIKSILSGYVMDNWYKSYTPEYYQRTYDIINSITVGKSNKTINGYDIEIYFDESKIRQAISTFEIPSGYPRFHHHMSVNGDKEYQGMSIAQWVVYWMNYGQDSPLYSYEGVNFLEDTISFTEEQKIHIKMMERLLEQKGFNVVVK